MSPREPEPQLNHCDSSGTLISLEESKQAPAVEPHQATKVRFSTIEMRTFNRIVGDGDVVVGPPVTFSWEFLETSAMPLEEYEENRPPKKRILRMSSVTRKNILRNVFEIPEEEIIGAEKEIQKIRSKQAKIGGKVESAVKSARRKFFRRFSRENVMKGIAVASGSQLWIHAGM